MERPLEEFKLPISGKTVKIVTFFTRGEKKLINSKPREGANLEWIGDDFKMSNLPVDFQDREDDEIVFQGVKEMLDGENKIEVSKQTLEEIPERDFVFILNKLKVVLSNTKQEKKS